MEDTGKLRWRKSSCSSSGNCVEVAARPDGDRFVRDSKDPHGAWLPVSVEQWRLFVARVTNNG
jgi:hypothetical protein